MAQECLTQLLTTHGWTLLLRNFPARASNPRGHPEDDAVMFGTAVHDPQPDDLLVIPKSPSVSRSTPRGKSKNVAVMLDIAARDPRLDLLVAPKLPSESIEPTRSLRRAAHDPQPDDLRVTPKFPSESVDTKR